MEPSIITNGKSIARPPKSPSRLGAIKKGTIKRANRLLFFGSNGTGKTTLCANSPSPIWLDIEDGSTHVPVARYPFRDGSAGHVPETFGDVLAAIDDLKTGDHEFKTLVIDGLDRLESLIAAHVVARINKPNIANLDDVGYGKGFQIALDEWRMLCGKLDALRETKGMDIVLIGHAIIKTWKSPTSADFDRFQLRLHDKASGLLMEWCDVVGFVCFEEGAGALDKNTRVKGFSTGRRLIKLQREAAFDAKSRLALPKEIEMDIQEPWKPFADAVLLSEGESPADIKAKIDVELVRLGDAELRAKVETAVKDANDDTAQLMRFLISLQQRNGTQPQ